MRSIAIRAHTSTPTQTHTHTKMIWSVSHMRNVKRPNNEIWFKWTKLHTISKVVHETFACLCLLCFANQCRFSYMFSSKYTSSINKSKLITWWFVQFLRQAICVFLFYHIAYVLAIFQSYFGFCFTRNDILSLNILRYSEMLCMKLFAKFCFSTFLGF